MSGNVDNAGSFMENTGAEVSKTITTNMGMFVLFVAVLIVSIYVMFQLYTIIMKTDLQTAVIVKDVKDIKAISKVSSYSLFRLNLGSDKKVIDLPPLNNGVEYSLSYWLYIDEFVNSRFPKLVTFSGTSDDVSAANIIMYLDPSYVKMHLLIRTTITSGISDNLANIHNSSDCNFFRLQVPYIPLNRWVNVTLVVDNYYIQFFIDGELRHVVDTSETYIIKSGDTASEQTTTECTSKAIVNNVGKYFYSGQPKGGESLNGFISKMKFFNYALTIDHAKMIYKTGPLHQSILSQLGLPLYGIRNPFYRVDSVAVDDDGDATI